MRCGIVQVGFVPLRWCRGVQFCVWSANQQHSDALRQRLTEACGITSVEPPLPANYTVPSFVRPSGSGWCWALFHVQFVFLISDFWLFGPSSRTAICPCEFYVLRDTSHHSIKSPSYIHAFAYPIHGAHHEYFSINLTLSVHSCVRCSYFCMNEFQLGAPTHGGREFNVLWSIGPRGKLIVQSALPRV